MNKFVFVKARNQELLCQAEARLRAGAMDQLTYRPSDVFSVKAEKGGWLVASYARCDSAGFEKSYFDESEAGVCAIDGLPYSEQIVPGTSMCSMFLRNWRDDEYLQESVFGTWAALRIDEDGGRALSDFTGMTPLFYLHNKDFLAVSTRQSLLSLATQAEPQTNTLALSWLTGQANLLGYDTPAAGVRLLPPQWTIAWSSRLGEIEPQLVRRDVWCSREEARVKSATEVADRLVAQADAMAPMLPDDIAVDITGGLDSRLAASVLLRSKVADKVRCLQTRGPEGAHEIQVGQAVASALGLEHRAIHPKPQQLNAETIFEQLRRGVFRYESSICPSDGLMGQASTSRVGITGSAGELYRRHCKPHMKVELADVPQLLKLFENYHQPTDPLGIQRPEISAWQRYHLQHQAMQFLEGGADLNSVTDVFFLQFRLPLWTGILHNNIFAGIKLYPLVNYWATQRAFTHPYQDRVQDVTHFELLAALAPGLMEVPFYKYVWGPRAQSLAKNKGVVVSNKPFPVRGRNGVKQLSVGSKMQVFVEQGWDLIREYLLSSPNTQTWDILSMNRTREVLTAGPSKLRGVVELKQIFAAMALQVHFLGDAMSVKDGAAVPSRRYHGSNGRALAR